MIFKDYSLSPLGGLSIEVKEDIWPRPLAIGSSSVL
jgi:hypothetical protein